MHQCNVCSLRFIDFTFMPSWLFSIYVFLSSASHPGEFQRPDRGNVDQNKRILFIFEFESWLMYS
uniref:Secreted protein n=1 Tax=Ascaris lumbricoides TaxID=6252 RepID=A0A0M3INL0_ASCLU